MKRWLIRTSTNHILGPVSKEKVVEFIESGSINENDEICSGNGYWFFIREKGLLERFLYNNEDQYFNPVSDALLEKKMRERTEQKNHEEIDFQTKIINLDEMVGSQSDDTQVESFQADQQPHINEESKKKNDDITKVTYYNQIESSDDSPYDALTEQQVAATSFFFKKSFYKIIFVLLVIFAILLVGFKNQFFNFIMDVANAQDNTTFFIQKKK